MNIFARQDVFCCERVHFHDMNLTGKCHERTKDILKWESNSHKAKRKGRDEWLEVRDLSKIDKKKSSKDERTSEREKECDEPERMPLSQV